MQCATNEVVMWKKSKAQVRREEDCHDAAEIANTFIHMADLEGRKLNNLQLQKLVYVAYGFNQAILGEPLFHDEIQAWPLGPVIPSLYRELKKYGWGDVTAPIHGYSPLDSSDPSMNIIEAVWESYGRFTAEELSALTHQDGTPWDATWSKGHRDEKIPDDLIRNHYSALIKDA
jgi:uncharacterized phage-associated protein